MPSDDEAILTVVTPVLNGERFIGRALASVRETRALGLSLSHIIVDGGSTDGTLEIIEEERRRADSPIRHVITGQDAGQADAINRGFRAATSRWLAWLNADDVYEPSGLLALSEAWRETEADVVLGRCEFVDERGRVVFRPTPPEPVTPRALLALESGWYSGRSIVQPETFIRAESFWRAGGLREDLNYSMDHELWTRMAILGLTFESHDLLVARQLVHGAQKTASNAEVVREQLTWATELLQEYGLTLADDRGRLATEIVSLGRKLCVYDAFVTELDRMGQGAQRQPAVNASADRTAIDIGTRSLPRRARVLGAQLSVDEQSHIRSQLRADAHFAITGGSVSAPGVFDLVVARVRDHKDQHMIDRAIASLRPGGLLVVLGEPGGVGRDDLASMKRELANRITWPQKTLIGQQADEAVLASLQSAPALGSVSRQPAGAERVTSFPYSSSAQHPIEKLGDLLGRRISYDSPRSSVYRAR